MRRPFLLGAVWVAAAGIAVGLGFLAVSFVSASPTASLVAATAPLATSSPSPAATTARQVTAGGTVVAHCTGGRAELAGAPAAGWRTDDSTGPEAVEFIDGARKIEVHATCPAGTPSFVVETPTAASDHPAVGSQSPTTDDGGDRHGGGHGGGSGGSSGGSSGGGGHGSDG